MKRKVSLVIKTAVFLVMLAAVLLAVMVVTERKTSYMKNKSFFEEAKKDHLDVLFIGSSHVINGINPIDLYEDYGITSYNLGGHGSLLKESYWQLIRALDYCKPKYVVVDCFMMDRNYEYVDEMYEETPEEFRQAAISQLHLNMDAYPLSKLKIAAVKDLVHDPKIQYQYLFDFIVYHNRWSELEQKDFQKLSGDGEYNMLMGAEMKHELEWNTNDMTEYNPEERLPEHTVCEEYLMKIIDECQRDGIGIVLTYLPFSAEVQDIQSANSAADIAATYGVPYINMLNMDGIIDPMTDLADPGHLSSTGAKKVTDYIGGWLSENANLIDHRGDEAYSNWDKLGKSYNKEVRSLSIRQRLLTTQLNMLTLGKTSAIVYVNEDSPALQDPWFVHLISNLTGTEKVYEASRNHQQYFMLIDRATGNVYEAADYEQLENMSTAMGEMTYIPVEKRFRLLYLTSDEDTNFLYDDEHLKDDVQIMTYDNENGEILSHIYCESSHSYEIDE
ncbi:hypothetical protein [Butyrivibrio sp. INlla16]|uniref:hypothetical protein n=1 Tax=Butyrivibrio sp. INlla16 TaxID=1520807 RepID=UPI0008891904|nr:hypothetical protein [Butyrivibrio sp. INlla16]SDB46866.1 hypothetical protein SAMN02910263_02308 [Butyrivibrio sp. INlla16]